MICWQTAKAAQTHHLRHDAWLVAASGSGDCFSAAGPGRLAKLEGNINKGKYHQILDDKLTQARRELQLVEDFISCKSTSQRMQQKPHT